MKPLYFLFIIISLFIISIEERVTCEQMLLFCKNSCAFQQGLARQVCESTCNSQYFRCVKNKK